MTECEIRNADKDALAQKIEQLVPASEPKADREQPKRQPLPARLPRLEDRHEPDSITCGCGCGCGCGCQLKRIGEDVAKKLDSVPGLFTVERHVRGKWVCAKCETLIQAPVAPHIIDRGIPTAGLLAKYADHVPLNRQQSIFAPADLAIPRSTLAAWGGQCVWQLQPRVDALKDELLTTPCRTPTKRRWPC